MIRHVVLWNLSSSDPEERRRAVDGMQERFTALVGVVPGLRSLTLAPDLGSTDGNWDVMLLSEHDDEDALSAYQAHPAHLEAAAFVRSVVRERACLDSAV